MSDGRTTLMILVIMSLFLQWAGYPSGGARMLDDLYGGVGLADPIGLAVLILGGIVVITGVSIVGGALTSSFGLIYTIPAAIGVILLGLFTVPLSFITEPAIPAELRLLVGAVFGVLILMTMFNFVRGGEV